MLGGFREGVEHGEVEIDSYVAKFANHSKYILLRNGLLEGWVDDVPQLGALSLIAPVLAEEPSDQRQVFDVVLAVKEGKLAVKVAESLSGLAVGVHLFDVQADLLSNRLHVLFVQIHAVAKPLNGCLERPELHTVQLDYTLSGEAEVLFSVCAFDDGDSISACASSHFPLIFLI